MAASAQRAVHERPQAQLREKAKNLQGKYVASVQQRCVTSSRDARSEPAANTGMRRAGCVQACPGTSCADMTTVAW